jgi:hypothetical protein
MQHNILMINYNNGIVVFIVADHGAEAIWSVVDA